MSILTSEQIIEIKKRKQFRDLSDSFGEMFNEAASNSDEVVLVQMVRLLSNNKLMANMFVLMAKQYSKLGRRVDLRMQSGDKYLMDVADENQALLEKTTFTVEPMKNNNVGFVFLPLCDLTKEQAVNDEVAKELALAFVRQHPTLQQSFLSLLRTASRNIIAASSDHSKAILKLASYNEPLPMI